MCSRFNRWLGVRFRLHPLFTVVMLCAVLTGHFLELVTLFGIVLIHELGHAAAAKHFGWRLREVRLTPFGGVVVTDEESSMPGREEAIVAVSGPAMNAAMIGFGWAMSAAGVWTKAWSDYFMYANAALMLFNLLPVLPLDGGRILQVAMGYVLPYYRTLKYAAVWSVWASAMLIGGGLAGLLQRGVALNVLYIGSFLLYANWYEWRTVPYRFFRFLLLRQLRVRKWREGGMKPQPIAVRPADSLAHVVRLLKREKLHFIVVLEETGRIAAILQEERCTEAYLANARNRAVSDLFM